MARSTRDKRERPPAETALVVISDTGGALCAWDLNVVCGMRAGR